MSSGNWSREDGQPGARHSMTLITSKSHARLPIGRSRVSTIALMLIRRLSSRHEASCAA
jgi:hypothetical protein